MKKLMRLASVTVALLFLNGLVVPCRAAEAVPASPSGGTKVTVVDPEFKPLSEEQEIRKGVKWYWWILGAAVIAGGVAAAASGGDSTTSAPATGNVSASW